MVKTWFDKKSSSQRNFPVGHLALKLDKPHEEKGEHTKFQGLCLRPFTVVEQLGPGTFLLQTLEGPLETYLVNAWNKRKNNSPSMCTLGLYIV